MPISVQPSLKKTSTFIGFTNRLIDVPVDNAEQELYNLRKDKWIIFFEENLTSTFVFYDALEDAFVQLFLENKILRNQTEIEFQLSLSFIQKMFDTGLPLIILCKQTARKLIILSLIYGKYPGMFLRPHINFIKNINTTIKENDIDELFIYSLVKYEIPEFLISQFDQLSEQEIEILILGLKGENCRTHPYFYTPPSSREFSELMQLKRRDFKFADKVILKTLIYIKIQKIQNSEVHLFNFLFSSQSFNSFPNNYLAELNFWSQAYRIMLLIENGQEYMSTTDYVDFLEYKKNENNDYNLRGRTPESLLRQVNEWHGNIYQIEDPNQIKIKWEGLEKLDLSFIYEKEDYQVKQLLNGKQLFKEGKNLKHCVKTYTVACAKGLCSVWSFRKKIKGRYKRLLTLEVINNEIVQARGKHNKVPKPNEIKILKDWAERMEFEVNLIKNS